MVRSIGVLAFLVVRIVLPHVAFVSVLCRASYIEAIIPVCWIFIDANIAELLGPVVISESSKPGD